MVKEDELPALRREPLWHFVDRAFPQAFHALAQGKFDEFTAELAARDAKAAPLERRQAAAGAAADFKDMGSGSQFLRIQRAHSFSVGHLPGEIRFELRRSGV